MSETTRGARFGWYGTYTNHHCRCDACKRASRLVALIDTKEAQ